MREFVSDNVSSETVQKFQDLSIANVFMEVANQMQESGMEPKDIKEALKTLYGATPEEISAIDEKLFKKTSDIKEANGKHTVTLEDEQVETLREGDYGDVEVVIEDILNQIDAEGKSKKAEGFDVDESSYPPSESVETAIRLLEEGIKYLKGEGTKPETNDLDALGIIAHTFGV